MPDFVQDLRELVDAESPSADIDAVNRAQHAAAAIGSAMRLPEPRSHRLGTGPVHLEWRLGDPEDSRRILLLGHVDTVWPIGTLSRRPFGVVDGTATGPGVFDMKAGAVVALHVLAALGADAPVTLLLTGDEEVGSASSRELIERTAANCQVGLVLEGAGPDGAVKTARKGWSFYTVIVRGVAAHAGLEPENGVNVLPVVADVVRRVGELDASLSDVTVNPTTAQVGSTTNTIPDHGELTVDVRCATTEDQTRVHDALQRIAADVAGPTRTELHGGVNRPPLQPSATRPVIERLSIVQERRGHEVPTDVSVGGISDANLVAALGVPTLDGLGAVGGGAHAEHEWVDVARTSERVPMLGALVRSLLENPITDAAPPDSGR